MKKFIHALILAVFSYGCLVTWAILSFASHVRHLDRGLPPFTIFCISLRPLVVALPILAAIFCLWVWFRKAEKVPSWMGFSADQ